MKTLLCLLLTTCAVFAQPANILVIIADDLGADSIPLTATGGTLPPMPNITALKNSGVLFRHAHSQPTCPPTRASMFTGRHPFRTGIGAQLTGAATPQLQTSEFTPPEAFAANSSLGYSLAMFGKWHLNSGAGTNDTPRTVGRLAELCGHHHRSAAGLRSLDENHQQRQFSHHDLRDDGCGE
jgi:arylsulfatase A-like enzyme